MVKFEKIDVKDWRIKIDDEEFHRCSFISSSITNKFHIISSFIEEMSEVLGTDFDNWFKDFISSYSDEYRTNTIRFTFLEGQIDTLKKYVNEFLNIKNFDYSQFVDESKAKKSSILFLPNEIRSIIQLSCYLKVYSVISNDEELKLDVRRHKKIYNMMASEISESEVIVKIFNVIKTKTFRYNLTDKYMWEYIKTFQCKPLEIHINEIFNFIMNSIIILCEIDKNPITYFVGVIEESINWFLRSVYKGSIIYDDSISSEDIHGFSMNNLITYSYNDSLGRLKGIALEQIYDTIERTNPVTYDMEIQPDFLITAFQQRLTGIEYISPLAECLTYPILSKLTEIPYNHFRTLSADHAAVLSCYTHTLLKKVFKSEYNNLFFLLDYYPTKQPAMATTYKLKAVTYFINFFDVNIKTFYGFKNKIALSNILANFIGRISRVSFEHLITGNEITGIPLSKIELDMVRFYSLLFSNKLDKELDRMRSIMDQDF